MTSVTRMTDGRIIALVGTGHMVSHFLQLALPPLFPLIRAEFDVSWIALGVVISVFYTASGIGQTASGFLVDRLGARPVLLSGMSLFAVAIALQGASPTYWTMLPIAALGGLGNSVFHPADYAILNASVSRGRLARAYSVHALSGNIGWVAAPIVVGGVSGLLGWRAALVTAGGLGLAVAVVVARGTRALARHADLAGRASDAPFLADVRLLLATPILVAFAFFALLATSLVGVQTFGVSAMVSIYAIPIAFATGALTAYLLGNAVGILAGGLMADRTSRHDMVAVTGMLAAAALMLVVASGGLPPTLLAVVLAAAGFALGITAPSRDMLVRATTPAGASGKVFGFVYSGLDLGSLIAPLIYGWLLDHGEPRAIFVTSAALMVVTIATVVQVRRRSLPGPVPATRT
jgi:MFS transporter, FSR family, fosmidomycin resistance protein